MAARRCRGGVTTSWISCLDTRNDQPRERPGYLQAQTLSTQLLPHGKSSGNAVLLQVSTLGAV